MLAVALAFGAAPARAQDTTLPAQRARLNGTSLRAGEFAYQMTLERGSGTTTIGTRTVTVAQTTYVGAPAWLLLETREGDGGPAADSLFTDLATLRPVHWGASLGKARLSVEFRGDTVYGGTSAPPGRRTMIGAIPAGSIVSAAMLESALRLLPLQTAWEDSTSIVSVSLGGMITLPARISVIGEDRVRVPAGQFDCWVVSVHAGDVARGLYWVTKRDPIVVRSTIDVPILGGAQLVSALTRYR